MLVWGQSSDPSAALRDLSVRLGAISAPTEALTTAAQVVAESLRLRRVDIEINQSTLVGSFVDHSGTEGGHLDIDLRYAGEHVGWLRLALRPGEARLARREERLVQELTPQVAAAAQAVRTAEALALSRERLLHLRSIERQRITRDLHDGIGPTLAGLSFGIERARESVTAQPGAAMDVLTDLGRHARRAVKDVRRMVHDLYPTELVEYGLVGALSQNADQLGAFTVVDPTLLAQLVAVPDDVQLAAYRIAGEALSNAARHSGAGEIVLELDVEVRTDGGGVLLVSVADEGSGGDPGRSSAGLGLTSMRERAESVGGRLGVSGRVAAGRTGGTLVRAELPWEPSTTAHVGQDLAATGPLEDADRPALPAR